MMSISQMMKDKDRIRNISVIAHVDHGKTTLVDSLLSKAGLIKAKNAGQQTLMDTRKDEQERGITIKSASVSLKLSRIEQVLQKQTEQKENEQPIKSEEVPYLINLIDSPGHVDFSSEVTAALRITDGAICVVDCIEGVCVQTETVLRQAILERVQPVLFLNKLDRVFLEQNKDLMDAYKLFRNTIESINVICHTYKDPVLGAIKLDPRKGNVAFGSGYFSWGFTLKDFADIYAQQFGLKSKKMMKYLWGNWYFDNKTKEWTKFTNKTDSNQLNGFCQFILKPIQVLHHSIMNKQNAIYEPIVDGLDLGINRKELSECDGKLKDLLRLIMGRWLPAGTAMLDLVADHLPSPIVAQRYRIPKLYTGPLDTPEAQSMLNCDDNGPLSVYISKMVPDDKDFGRFIAFGRVFSGTIKRGQNLRILGPSYVAPQMSVDGEEEKTTTRTTSGEFYKKVSGIYLMMGRTKEKIQECPAGNCVGLMGIDQYLMKSGTLTDNKAVFPFKTMKFSVSAVVKKSVECVNAKDLPKLIEGLKRLAQTDQLLKQYSNNQGQRIIAGAGELHLEICVKDLQQICKDIPLRIGNPIVSFCETVSGSSGSTVKKNDNKNAKNKPQNYPSVMIAKSANKLNKLHMTAEPISNDVIKAIEDGNLRLIKADMKRFSRQFQGQFPNDNISKDDASKIWTFGCPPDGQANILIDQTKGVPYVQDIRSSIISGFTQFTMGGVLCDEVVKGIQFELVDAKVHSDPPHRGPGQIIPASKRAFKAGQLASNPKLLEPMYLVNIEVPIDSQNGVYNTLGKVRGVVDSISDKLDLGIPISTIKAFVPIIETFGDASIAKDGFTELLRKNTKGKAFPIMQFSHWEKVIGDPMEIGSPAYQFLMSVRKRKGMKLDLPNFGDYYDRQ